MTGQGPALRVVRGDPSPEEVAALVAVLATRRRAAAPTSPASQASATTIGSAWSDRSRLLPAPMVPGPDGWRRSAFPR